MEKTAYLGAIEREAAAFAAAARQRLEAPAPAVPSCPGWNSVDLVLHLGGVHRWVRELVHSRRQTPLPFKEMLPYMAMPPQYIPWLGGAVPREAALPSALVDWFEEGAARLVQTLAEVGPDEPVWTWGNEQKAAHWPRTQAIEVLIHRWDAQQAVSREAVAALEPELALDGIDWVFDVLLPSRLRKGKNPAGSGETYHLHRTDGPGEWLLTFGPEGLVVTKQHAKGDVALRGSASNLLLFLHGRIGSDELEVFGKTELIPRYFELTAVP